MGCEEVNNGGVLGGDIGGDGTRDQGGDFKGDNCGYCGRDNYGDCMINNNNLISLIIRNKDKNIID